MYDENGAPKVTAGDAITLDDVAFSSIHTDLSESKTNNLLVADEGVGVGNAGIDVLTGKGNNVVILKSIAGGGNHNSIDYVGGTDAFQGSAGSDAFTVKSMDKNTALTINDLNGANDLVEFAATTGATSELAHNTIFFDVKNDAGVIKTSDDTSLMFINNDVLTNNKSLLALFNGNGKGSVSIANYFDDDQAFFAAGELRNETKGNGYIENFKFTGSVADSLDEKVAAIAENVSAWLANNGNYDSAMDVIESGNAADIQSLMVCYSAGTMA